MQIDISSWRWRMVRAGLSVNELSRTMGKPAGQVSGWLNMRNEPRASVAGAIESIIQQAERKAGIE